MFVAPLLETALMGWFIRLLQKRELHDHLVVLLSAALWAALHRIGTNGAGWLAFFPFVMYSSVYIVRNRGRHADGFLVAAMAHGVYNVIATFSMIASGLVH